MNYPDDILAGERPYPDDGGWSTCWRCGDAVHVDKCDIVDGKPVCGKCWLLASKAVERKHGHEKND
jgi:hypothetical protein